MKEYLNTCKDILCSWVRKLSIRMAIIPKATYGFNEIPIKTQMLFVTFFKTGKTNSQIHVKCKGPQTAKTILKKKNKIGGLTPPNFKTYTATVIKAILCWHTDGHIVVYMELNWGESRNKPIHLWPIDF